MKRLINRKGFVSMSLIYAFFIVFIAIMLALLADYANNRILAHTLNQDIMEHLDTSEDKSCQPYTINNSILNNTIDYDITKDNNPQDGDIHVQCEGYYQIVVKGADGINVSSNTGGKSPTAKIVVRLRQGDKLGYSVGNMSSEVSYNNSLLIKSTSANPTTDTSKGTDGEATFAYENYTYNQYAEIEDIANSPVSTLDIIYLGTVLN